MTNIHATALVDPQAQLADSVTVGAFAYIGSNVILGEHCIVEHHATIDGYTEMGPNNHVYPYSFLGAKTHDLKFKGGRCSLKIGQNNVFREYVSVHTSTQDGGFTSIGDDNYFLAFAHIGHDCMLQNHIIVSAQVAMGGHVHIGNYANIGGNSSIHQFCRVGDYAMLGGHSYLKKDLPPFMLACGVPAIVKIFNRVGMMRNGFSEAERSAMKHLFQIVYESNLNRSQALKSLQDDPHLQKFPNLVHTFSTFSTEPSCRGLI